MRNSILDKLHPPFCFWNEWEWYWTIRRGEKLLRSEVLAYKELTGADIGEYELGIMLNIDDYVSSALEKKRKEKD